MNYMYFSLKENYNLQIEGTAIGTRMAPSYANLTMGKLEREFLWTNNILATWTHGEQVLQHFTESLINNRHHPTIKFTSTW